MDTSPLSTGKSIDVYKRQAILSAYEDDYTTAIKNQAQAAQEVARTFDDYSAAKKRAKKVTDCLLYTSRCV